MGVRWGAGGKSEAFIYDSVRISPSMDAKDTGLARRWNGYVVYMARGARLDKGRHKKQCAGCEQES